MGLGVLGSGGRQARPRWAKARRASRTVWVAQLSAAAICEGRQPWSLCSRTWQRRTVKALGERRPQRREVRSVSAKGRTKRGDFIPHDTHRRQLHRLPFAFPLTRSIQEFGDQRASAVTLAECTNAPSPETTHDQGT